MYDIDRIAAVIKPKQPMLDWLNQILEPDEESRLITLNEIREDCTAFLLPVFANQDDAMAFLAEIYETLFDNELASWILDDTMWPEQRTFDMFMAWFDIEFHSSIFDLGNIDENLEPQILTLQ